MDSTALRTVTPSSFRTRAASAPARVRGAVVRALARSRMLRMFSTPNLMLPGRSAWPGLGAVTAFSLSAAGEMLQGFITPSQCSHSALSMEIPTGPPVVRPFRIPPQRVSSSRSTFFLPPLPNPRLRRAMTPVRSSREMESPAGSPSTTTRSPLLWDSPLVRNLQAMVRCTPQ